MITRKRDTLLVENLTRRDKNAKEKKGDTTVKVDSKVRVVAPKEMRTALGVGLGDKHILRVDDRALRLTGAVEDLIAVSGKHAEAEYRAGRTENLRDYMQDRDIKKIRK